MRCFSCNHEKLESFYRVDDVPVHSILLMRTAEEALSIERRSVDLGVCTNCGFVQNLLFDPSVHDYSSRYEETQGFSPSFRGFAASLARELIDRHALNGKRILEIGTGKGEFLALLCELGGNVGFGLDPAYVPGRLESPALSRMTFVREFYEEHTELTRDVDFIACRHTLEHIQETASLIGLIRRSMEDREDIAVFFEVPDITRILEECAFWDIFYEHCSYFDPGSLSRLFRSTGFQVSRLYRGFDDQYVMIECSASRPSSDGSPALEEPVAASIARVRRFEAQVIAAVDAWNRKLDEMVADNQKVAVWGAGSKAVSFLTTLGQTDRVNWLVDINPFKRGTFLPGTGHEIISPTDVATREPDVVICMNPVYREEITRDLVSRGIQPRIITV